MHISDVLHDIVRNLPTDHIPIDYVTMVKLTDRNGNLRSLKGHDLVEFFENPSEYDAVETRLVVNAAKIHTAIRREVQSFYREIERRQENRYTE